MNRLRNHLTVVALGRVLAALVLGACVSCVRQAMEERVREQRVEDMSNIMRAYVALRDSDTNNHVSMDDIMKYFATAGVRLHNPIPVDSSKPCYRFHSEISDDHSLKSTILVEEFNVRDAKQRVVGLVDGSVAVFNKARSPELFRNQSGNR